jgi:hypothetical protein
MRTLGMMGTIFLIAAILVAALQIFVIGPHADERNPKYDSCRNAGGVVMIEITSYQEKKAVCVERHEIKGIL